MQLIGPWLLRKAGVLQIKSREGGACPGGASQRLEPCSPAPSVRVGRNIGSSADDAVIATAPSGMKAGCGTCEPEMQDGQSSAATGAAALSGEPKLEQISAANGFPAASASDIGWR